MKMKSPLSYYGGKQNLVSKILPMFPEHVLYGEPFAGGAALFFAKEPSEVEVLNDKNTEVINFYKVLKSDFISLKTKINITLHSRSQHKDASVIYNNPHLFNELDRAWALWVMSSQSFASILDNSWGFDKIRNTTSKKIYNKVLNFNEDLAIRLQNVQIECADALYIIKSRDFDKAFFYCDPPYYNSNMGHYRGYSLHDFEMLLTTLTEVKGKFLLSSYPSDMLTKFTKENKWHSVSVEQTVSVDAKSRKPRKTKVEVMTANYQL